MNNKMKKIRDESGYKWALASAKHHHEICSRTNLMGEPIPFKNEPNHTTYSAYQAGFDAASAIYEEREKKLLEVLKEIVETNHCDFSLDAIHHKKIASDALYNHKAEGDE